MIKTVSKYLLALSLVSVPAFADVMGVKAGYQYWKSEVSGNFGEGADSVISNDTGENSFTKIYAGFEHPIPLLPNLEVALTQHQVTASATVDSTYRLGSQTFAVSSELEGKSDTTSYDFLFYYEVLDTPILDVDLGLNAMLYTVDYDVSDVGSTASGSNDVSTLIPMAYVKVQTGLPLLGISGFASIMSGSDAEKLEAGLAYKFVDSAILDMTLTLGYRETTITLDDVDDIFAQSEYDGVFLGVQIDI